MVTPLFMGCENAELPGALALALAAASRAKRIVIGVETRLDTFLSFSVASDPQALIEGDNRIGFKAYIRCEPRTIAQQNFRAGQYRAVSTFP